MDVKNSTSFKAVKYGYLAILVLEIIFRTPVCHHEVVGSLGSHCSLSTSASDIFATLSLKLVAFGLLCRSYWCRFSSGEPPQRCSREDKPKL